MSSSWTEDDLLRYRQRMASYYAPISAPAPKPAKYRNRKTEVDGIVFDSAKEAARYQELKLMVQGGVIVDLVLQPKFALWAYVIKPDGPPDVAVVGDYVADFAYMVIETGALITEDVKGFKTSLYRWKKKHFEAQYGIKISEL